MDVHKESIAIAVADGSGGEPATVATIANDTGRLLKQLLKLGRKADLRCCYEAGPTGYGLDRDRRAAGIHCVLIAASIDEAKKAERVARHELSKFLLRHARIDSGKTAWTLKHLDWIRKERFEQEAQQRVLTDYLHTVEEGSARVERLTRDITGLVESWHLAPLVKSLQALRGVQLVTAVIIAAELGDFGRFATAPQLMAYLGLVPSEHSSGESKQRGRITKAGNSHVRRVLVEAAWSYRFRPNLSAAIRERNEGVGPTIRAIAWKAQERLHRRYARMMGRGKSKQKTVTAVARELAGFVWAIGREQERLAS
jgi:transposase